MIKEMDYGQDDRTVIVNRDLGKMFEGLVVAESVLLKNSARETLFRKPS